MDHADTTILRELSPHRRTREEARDLQAASPGWGSLMTDHMVTATYTPEQGWHGLAISPFGSFQFHPATSVLHYGQAIFEGLKAYRQPDGSIASFRPDRNAQRFIHSAERLAMPPLPQEMFLASLQALVEADSAWVPDSHGASLYLRPNMYATDAVLMTRPSRTYRYVLFACPVSDYFPNGVKPVTVWVSRNYVRAVKGGTGEAKCAGNYAASYLVQRKAAEQGCDQVVWLDAIDRTSIEEMGGMNMFFVKHEGGRPVLITPEATGSLLRGVTRESILILAKDLGYGVEERRITFDEWQAGCADGSIAESFACGTAAVITPIGTVKHDGGSFQVADGGTGDVTATLRKALLDIQHGLTNDQHGWRHELVGPA